MPRISRDSYFLQLAKLVATRSTCARRQVGCVIVNKDHHIVATGYNGVPRGFPHCKDELPCPGANAPSGEALDKCFAIHAEMNALLQCPNVYEPLIMYTTVFPCIHCAKLIANTNIYHITYLEDYPGSGLSRNILGGKTIEKGALNVTE